MVFDRYEQQLQVFVLKQAQYRSVELDEPRYWFEPLELGIGIWTGKYYGIEGKWLRWYDRSGNCIQTSTESAIQEITRADQEAIARRSAVPRLLAIGLTPLQVSEALGLSVAEIESFRQL